MESQKLPRNSEALFALAEELADILAEERHITLRIEPHAEARLRTCIAAAMYARAAYGVILQGVKNSQLPDELVAEARRACIRKEHVLRVCMLGLLAAARMQLNEEDPLNFADYVLA